MRQAGKNAPKVTPKKLPISAESKHKQNPSSGAPEAEAITPDSTREFFLIVAPGLEDLAEFELRDWLPEARAEVVKGGLSITLPLKVGFALNRALKIPTRILVRVADFGCRDFPKLFKKMSNFPWESWFPDDIPVEFQASSKTSWLKVKKRIEETCEEGRAARVKKRGVSLKQQGEPLTVFVRLENDVCFMSLDTSGELLHKRGYRTLASEAPLRETIASALLCLTEVHGLAGEVSSVELVDPMMGGGTFLLEAAQRSEVLSGRTYAFERFVLSSPSVELRSTRPNIFEAFSGFDLDAKAVEAAKGNLKTLGQKKSVRLEVGDAFKLSSPGVRALPRVVITNPPWGERIAVKGRLSDFYSELFQCLESAFQPQAACFLLPEKAGLEKIRAPREWKLVHHRRFLNGGISVQAAVYQRVFA